ncbi:DNA polymerase IV [Candidatus Marsarchaeota archaeon]|nr:DNA polymerase IV [Candidatus Marsarchaeota archaeon]
MLVLYIDMDYFFAACEELRHPEFKGKPLIVGTSESRDSGKGVVMTCNYEARKYGIHSAMPIPMAVKLKRDVNYLHEDWDYYQSISDAIMARLREFGNPLDIMSIDEAAMGISDMNRESALGFAKEVKKAIQETSALPCTVAVSSGKVFAKMACDSAKPDGLKVVMPEDVKEFIGSMDIGKMPGIGPKTSERLNAIGISKISQLASADPMVLIDALGSFGKELYLLANGTDNSRLVETYDILSISREKAIDPATKADEVYTLMEDLSRSVIDEIGKKGLWFRTVSVKARYDDFSERIKSKRLGNYTDSLDTLIETARRLTDILFDGRRVRKYGVRVSSLIKSKGQKRLF